MDWHGEPLEYDNSSLTTTKKRVSPSFKKSTGFSKLASKVTRKKSLKKEKHHSYIKYPATSDNIENLVLPSPPPDSGVPGNPCISGSTPSSLSKLSSKSEDSLDSGIYSAQKSCDSVDSIGITQGTGPYTDWQRSEMSYIPGKEPVSTAEEDRYTTSFTNASKYDDYWREYQDIRQSVVVQDDDFEEKSSVVRTDSGDDDDESDWFRQAGLAGLVTSTNLSSHVETETDTAPGNTGARLSTDSLTSMTILSTLTRPQREAVLRRITSFNRAQKTRRRPVQALFPQSSSEDKKGVEGLSSKPPVALPKVEVTHASHDVQHSLEKTSKSTSLPYKLTGYGESNQRRYSEVTHRSGTASSTDAGHFSPLISAFSTSSLETGHIVKLDQKGYQRKEPLDSIVATEPSALPNHRPSQALAPLSSSPQSDLAFIDPCFFRSHGRSLSCPSESFAPLENDASPFRTITANDLGSRNFTFFSSDQIPAKLLPTQSNVSYSTANPTTSSNVPPNKSFLHGYSSKQVKFSSSSQKMSPLEFLPITLTTSVVTIRPSRVIQSFPSSFRSYPSVVKSNPTKFGFSKPELSSCVATLDQKKNNSLKEGPTKDLTSPPPNENIVAGIDSEGDLTIAFKSMLNLPAGEFYNTAHQSNTVKSNRPSSLKARGRKFSNRSPHHKSAKLPQISLSKVATLSLSDLSPSPNRLDSHNHGHGSRGLRKLKRASSLYGETGGTYISTSDPAYFSVLDPAKSTSRNSISPLFAVLFLCYTIHFLCGMRITLDVYHIGF